VLEAAVRLLPEAAQDDPLQVPRHLARGLGRRPRLLLEEGGEHLGLLRGHVGRRPGHRPRAAQARRRVQRGGVVAARPGVRRQLGEAEVQDLHDAVRRHHDVAGLEVAVDHAPRVGGAERVRDRDREAQGLAQAHSLARDEGIEGLPGHELHHDEVDPVRGLDLVDGDDVGVVERGGRAGLVYEAGAAGRIREPIRGEDLDRHLAPESGVGGAVDLAHPARAERRQDLVRTETMAGGQSHHLTQARGRRARLDSPGKWSDGSYTTPAVRGAAVAPPPVRARARRGGVYLEPVGFATASTESTRIRAPSPPPDPP
jgi:hypothetical protein